ncbi:MAG: hypothetical protein ACJ8LG_14805 [Massilia sp.]
MRAWLKGALLAALVFGACWGCAIFYWQATDSMFATSDLVLYLLALPLALLLAFWLGSKLIASRAAAPAIAAPAQSTKAGALLLAPPPLAILAASLRSPHGASVEELSAAIADNKARADLDQELVDDDGFPVMTARSGDATDEALQEDIGEWLSRNGMPELRFSDEQWRALTLASAVVDDLASHAASNMIPSAGSPPMLQLVPILPAEWPIEQRRAFGMWLKHTVDQSGWPHANITVAPEVTAENRTPSAVLGRLAHDAGATNVPLAAMIVACASHIGDESVAQLAASSSLFTSSHPQGLIPGEGAAGLLVTDLAQARSIEGAAFALLDPVSEARRDSSADDTRRADPKLLGELVQRALKHAPAELSEVAMMLADTGHRSNRVLELMGLASAAMPQLDGATDVMCIGAATGSCGIVPFMTALALAHHHALEGAAPVLCISNEDPYRRCATLVRPAASLA